MPEIALRSLISSVAGARNRDYYFGVYVYDYIVAPLCHLVEFGTIQVDVGSWICCDLVAFAACG
jgi:hypothetical protein